MSLDDLDTDGATVTLEDGRCLRLRIEPDEDYNPFEECDAYGKIAPVTKRGYYPDPLRPHGFDGNAEKLSLYDNGATVWWQPPEGAPKRGMPEFRKLRSLVLDLASYGCHCIILEELGGKDAYGVPYVIRYACLGGVDTLQRDYLLSIVRDLAAELGVGRGA